MATNYCIFDTVNCNRLNTVTQVTNTGALNFGDGSVTQLTSNSTAVTLNSSSGTITMFGVINSTVTASFTVNNSLVTASSVVIASVGQAANGLDSGVAPLTVNVNNVQAGSFQLNVTNGGGSNATHVAIVRF